MRLPEAQPATGVISSRSASNLMAQTSVFPPVVGVVTSDGDAAVVTSEAHTLENELRRGRIAARVGADGQVA